MNMNIIKFDFEYDMVIQKINQFLLVMGTIAKNDAKVIMK